MGLSPAFGGNDNGSTSNSLGGAGKSDKFEGLGGCLESAGAAVTAGKSGSSGSMPKAYRRFRRRFINE